MHMVIHVKCPLFLSFIMKLGIFLDRFSRNSQISDFMKIRLVGDELLHADGQTDMTKQIIAFAILRTHLKYVKIVVS